MARIDFSKGMSIERAFPSKQQEAGRGSSFESDRGRIINSAAIRRLQQKTQVFPLEKNAAVRSRLTHSLEVQQIGRYIAKAILERITASSLAINGLKENADSFISLVEMACLMHDVGNPPFGHSGEAALSQWFRVHLVEQSDSPIYQHFKRLSAQDSELAEKMARDLCDFEGNAQGIRIIHSLQKLNLTYAQVASVLKYTRPAYRAKNAAHASLDYLMRKPGYYLSEESFIQALWQALSITPHHRHPFAYIMEAADDISYCIADLEDAVEKSLLSVESLYQLLRQAWQKSREAYAGDLFTQTVEHAYQLAQKSPSMPSGRTQSDQFFMTLRVETVNRLVNYVADEFIGHIDVIAKGEYNRPIIGAKESENEACCLLSIYKEVAFEHVFNQKEVTSLEEMGRTVLHGLLSYYSALLAMPMDVFTNLFCDDSLADIYPREFAQVMKLSPKYCQAYHQATAQKQETSCFALWEFYYRCRLLQDYISGMTDNYAQDEYTKLVKK